IVEAERAPKACGAEHGPEELLLEEKVRVVEPVGGHDRARGVDHHDAGGEQHDRDAKQPHVGHELAWHYSTWGGASAAPPPHPPTVRRCAADFATVLVNFSSWWFWVISRGVPRAS